MIPTRFACRRPGAGPQIAGGPQRRQTSTKG